MRSSPPLGGGGLLAGIGSVMRARKPAVKVSPPNRKPLRRSPPRWPRGEAVLLRRLDAVVRRRRRRQVGAADDVAAAEGPGRRFDRDAARRHRRRHAPCGRTRACRRRRRRRLRDCRRAQRPCRQRQGRRDRVRRQHRPGDDSPTSWARRNSRHQSQDHHMSEERFATAAPLPAAFIASTNSRSTCGGAGTERARRCSGVSTTRGGATRPTTRCGCCSGITAERLNAAARMTRNFSRRTTRRSLAWTRRARKAHPWWQRTRVAASAAAASPTSPPSSRCTSRCRSMPAASACSPATTARKPRPRRAARRHRLHVSAGILPPAHDQRRLAGGALRAHQLDRRADRSRAHARRQAVHHGGAARRSHGAGRGLARAARPRPAVPARHRPRGKRAVGSRAVGAPLRRRSRNPHPAGDHPRHRRRPRAARPGHRRRRCGTSTKATPRSSRCSASAKCIEQGTSFDEALEEVRRTTVFTTHTPVPAGHDAFPFHLVEKHLAGSWGEIGEHRQRFLALGEYDNGSGSQFNMTALALRTSAHVNGVSALHGEVTRTMWRPMWPEIPGGSECRSSSITNGVHVPTWMGGPMFAPARPALRPRLAGSRRRTGALGAPARHPGRRAVAGAPVAAHGPVLVHPRADAIALAVEHVSAGAHRRRRRDARSGRARPSASPAASPPTSGRS